MDFENSCVKTSEDKPALSISVLEVLHENF